jgi:hypothetical protein
LKVKSLKTEEKLKRAKKVCGVEGLGKLLDLAFEALLEKKDPARREERRRKRETLQVAQHVESRHAEPQAKHPNTKPIPVKLKDKLLREVGYQCTFVSPDGRRCTEKQRLEVEHVSQRAKGGSNDPSNLTILCRRHNVYQGAMHFGWEKMRGPSLRSG